MTLPPDEIKDAAGAIGFMACGITDLSPLPHADALDRWLAAGYGGTMRYLHRQARKRKEPARILGAESPPARVAVVVLDNYYFPDTERDLTSPKIAKYARGRDYHLATKARLDRLATFCRSKGATVAEPYVDAGPVPERELAQRAGLGWIGKNTMLIRPGMGAFFFIGVVLTDLDLELDSPFETDRCGSCTLCLEACPTTAFVAPRVLDATRCISYLTIESREPIPEEFAPKLEGWGFGCDICNDVCPWNHRFAVSSTHPEFAARPDPGKDPEYFERLTPSEFDRRFGATPLERPGLEGMRRNWKAALRSRQPETTEPS